MNTAFTKEALVSLKVAKTKERKSSRNWFKNTSSTFEVSRPLLEKFPK
jgi:hypothetical protein